jgi:hypothetical protein
MRKRKYTPPHEYTAAEKRFLERKVAGRSYADLTELFDRRFGLSLTENQIKKTVYRLGLSNGRDCRIRPGTIPPSKGKKGYCPAGSEKGWFRPGQRPLNKMPVGAERINGDGYVDVRIHNPTGKKWKNWKPKHRIIWERAYGKIPRGHVVIFADGNRLNVTLDNLMLVSRGELAVMNRRGLVSNDKDLTRAGKTIADIKLLITKRKRGAKKKKSRGMEKKDGRY